MKVHELIALLQAHPFQDSEVRVGITDGTTWSDWSAPVTRVVDHVGAWDEGAHCCLEIPNAWGHCQSGRPDVAFTLPDYEACHPDCVDDLPL